MAQKANIKNVELTNLTINFKDVWYLSSTNKLCTAHTAPTSNSKYPPKPINVKIKSAIDAPKGPPKLFTSSFEFLLKKPESLMSYETNETKIYKEKAIKKKLKKFSKVFLIYGGI